MVQLLVVSMLWAVSFGLVAQVAPLGAPFVAATRTLLAALVFVPLIRVRGLSAATVLRLGALGGLQFGAMYVLYIQSFHWLRGAEVALFTIFTPLLVSCFGGLLARRMPWASLLAAALAVLGTAICLGTTLERRGLWLGFLCVQGSNACFALGQVLYRRLAPATGKSDRQLMGLLYAGAAVVTVAVAAPRFSLALLLRVTWTQGAILAFLGIVASGLGFFLFNAGARRTDLGTLAVFNNAKVPLAVLASALIFHDPVHWPRLGVGGAVMAAALGLNHWLLRMD